MISEILSGNRQLNILQINAMSEQLKDSADTFFLTILYFLDILKIAPKMPLHVVTLNPKKFKADATHTCWVSHTRWVYALNMQNTILRFKYRQGYRLAGEHLRVGISITYLSCLATHVHELTIKIRLICIAFMQTSLKKQN